MILDALIGLAACAVFVGGILCIWLVLELRRERIERGACARIERLLKRDLAKMERSEPDEPQTFLEAEERILAIIEREDSIAARHASALESSGIDAPSSSDSPALVSRRGRRNDS